MPKLNELSDRPRDQGLVLIGVHTYKKSEAMAAFVEDNGIRYPVASDGGETVAAYGGDSYPDYDVIDRSGKLRVADLANGDLERTIGVLLAEPAQPTVHTALIDTAAIAVRKEKRMLALWGTESERAAVRALTKADRDLAKLQRNEFELIELGRAAYPELASSMAGGLDGPMLVALHADGRRIAAISTRDLDGAGLRGFLEQHRMPALDAEVLWAEARARAERENKRVLVHLGAPW